MLKFGTIYMNPIDSLPFLIFEFVYLGPDQLSFLVDCIQAMKWVSCVNTLALMRIKRHGICYHTTMLSHLLTLIKHDTHKSALQTTHEFPSNFLYHHTFINFQKIQQFSNQIFFEYVARRQQSLYICGRIYTTSNHSSKSLFLINLFL